MAVVLGERSSARRNQALTRLLDKAFDGVVEGERDSPLFLASLTAEADGPVKFVLPNGVCNQAVSRSPRLDQGKLEGWGLLFGSFMSAEKARSVAVQQQKALAEMIGRNRVAIVKGARSGITRYSALLVGLDRSEAGPACKHTWTDGTFCQVLGPEGLNNKHAIWR